MPLTRVQQLKSIDATFFRERKVQCPAGRKIEQTVEGPACVCRVEDSLVTAAKDPTSLHAYCMGDYQQCPTWRAEKEHIWADGAVRRLLEMPDPEVQRSGKTMFDREDAPQFSIPAG